MLCKKVKSFRQELKEYFENFNDVKAEKFLEFITSLTCVMVAMFVLITLNLRDIAEIGINVNILFPCITTIVLVAMLIFTGTFLYIVSNSFWKFFVKKHLSDSLKTESGQGIGQKDEKLP